MNSARGCCGQRPSRPWRWRCLLVFAKTWAWLATDSVSLLSSLADSTLDVLASGLTFWAVRFSLSPADPEHRFGHGKSEGLAALIQGLIIAGSGVFVCREALQRLIEPRPIEQPEIGLLVIGGATIATLLLVAYQRYVSRKTGSVAIARTQCTTRRTCSSTSA